MIQKKIPPSAPTSSRIFHGNCIDILKKWNPESVDMILCDPPYLVNYRDKDGRGVPGDRTSEWLRPAFKEIARVLKKGRYCISFFGWNHAEKFLLAWKEAGLFPVGQFIFMKSYSSKNGVMRSTHESAYLLAKGRGASRTPNFLLNSVIPWSYSGNKLHPTQKPVSSLTPLIGAFSDPHEIVLDPFMGSGSTGIASMEAGRRFLGIELDANYFAIAKERLGSYAVRPNLAETAKRA